jgi:hypothetical protein
MSENETPAAAQPALMGVGLDMGTMNIVAARRQPAGVVTKRIRDSFIDLPKEHKRMLKLSNVNYIQKGDDIIIVGDAAYEMANVFGREVRRPLAAGLIAAGEIDALEILGVMVREVLGDPATENEICVFSVPAAPVDDPSKDIVYHKGILERIVNECGYKAIPSNEALAIIYAECGKDQFSGIAFSFGSGMTNVALAIRTVEALSFSVGRGGDWIDAGAAKSVGATQARMCAIKEKGLNLMKPVGREQEALVVYYKNLIEYALDNVVKEFQKISAKFDMPFPVPIVVSGGTSKAEGFLDFFKEVFESKKRKFPIEVSVIRAATEPLDAVARGLLVQAVQEYDE